MNDIPPTTPETLALLGRLAELRSALVQWDVCGTDLGGHSRACLALLTRYKTILATLEKAIQKGKPLRPPVVELGRIFEDWPVALASMGESATRMAARGGEVQGRLQEVLNSPELK